MDFITSITHQAEATFHTEMDRCYEHVIDAQTHVHDLITGNYVGPADTFSMEGEYVQHKNLHLDRDVWPFNVIGSFEFERVWMTRGNYFASMACYPQALPWLGFLGAFLYCVGVHGGAKIMERYQAWDLRWTMRGWNLFLAIFSLIGAYRTMPHLLYKLFVHQHDEFGWTYTFCETPMRYYGSGAVGFASVWFVYSKFFEFFDTAILVLRKKPVGFLHWFHHATVLLFCWDAYRTHQTTGLYFIAMNYFVHAIMYFYYFLTACGYRPKWAPIVTTLQIVQMVIGMLVSFWHYYLKQYSGRRCHGSVTNLHFCFAMYLSYFALFMQFALRRYFWSKPKPVAVEAKVAPIPAKARSKDSVASTTSASNFSSKESADNKEIDNKSSSSGQPSDKESVISN